MDYDTVITAGYDANGSPLSVHSAMTLNDTVRTLHGDSVIDNWFPSSAQILSISSTSTEDSSTGTGARMLYLVGTDDTHAQVIDMVALNGTTPVNSNLTFRRVNFAQVIQAGSNATNTGTITISNSGQSIAAIQPTKSKLHRSLYTIPSGNMLLIVNCFIQTEQDCYISLYQRFNGVETELANFYMRSSFNYRLKPYLKLSQGSDLYCKVNLIAEPVKPILNTIFYSGYLLKNT